MPVILLQCLIVDGIVFRLVATMDVEFARWEDDGGCIAD